MKRKDLPHEKLDRIIKLRQLGASWSKIERETGIHRRTAKRAYDKWERSQTLPELKEARKDVIQKAFLDHLSSLTTLTGSVVANLKVPASLAGMEKNSEQFFACLWDEDLLNRFASMEVETEEARVTIPHPYVLDLQSYRREKELLFQCLQDHTRGEGVRWEVLEEWKKARDRGAKIIPKLRKETSEVVNNFLKQEREMNFLQRVEEESGHGHPAEQMVGAVLSTIWECILQDKLDEEGPWFETVPHAGASSHVVYRKAGKEVVLGVKDKGRAERVTRICELATNNLGKGDMAKQLHNEVCKMEKTSEELSEMLNPVRLTPMILRTRCDLCPA